MENYIEDLVAEYYITRGFFVTTNYWFPFQSKRERHQRGKNQSYKSQSWTDVDVLAKGENELLIIQVKATINERKVAEKIIKYFQRVEDFLKKGVAPDGVSDIKWWKANSKVIKIVVYGEKSSPKSYLDLLHKKHIETKHFGELLEEILNYIQKKKGIKEENAAMQLLHFLKKEELLKTKNAG
jgi:hypothetical protein